MTKSPPIPPANRSPHGGKDEHEPKAGKGDSGTDHVPENLDLEDRQGNIKQNTTNQGYQQDR